VHSVLRGFGEVATGGVGHVFRRPPYQRDQHHDSHVTPRFPPFEAAEGLA